MKIELDDEAATIRLGEDIAAALRPGDVVALSGPLGAGKTVLSRAIIRALAGDDGLEVLSPTFTLAQPYGGRLPVLHVDLYRIASPDEIDELGIEEAAAEGVVLIEWPERAEGALAGEALRVTLSGESEGRLATMAGPPEALARIERSLAARRFLEGAGAGEGRRRHLTGDASMRAYETVETSSAPVRILMNAPARPDGPPIRDGKPYSRVAHLAETVAPFVAIARLLGEAGFAAPEILAADLEAGFLLVEHLGSLGMLDDAGAPVPERYLAAAELLAAMHAMPWPRQAEAAPGTVHEIPHYDRGAMEIELELLLDWYLPYARGKPANDAERAGFFAAWRIVLRRLSGEETLVMRDFHSPNLIWREDRRGHARLGLIDFQDALIGPPAYDLASLAQDARVTVDAALEARILEAYLDARRSDAGFDEEGLRRDYAIMAAQRNTKILGIFVRLCERDGKPGYLGHLRRLQGYLDRAPSHPALEPVAACYRELGILKEEGA